MIEDFSTLNNAANRLTLLRGVLVPVLALFYLLPSQWSNQVAAVLLCIAALTDFLDGLVARFYRQETKVGEYLDQAIDKVLVVTALLLVLFRFPYLYVLAPVLITVLREFCVLSLRDWLKKTNTGHMAVGTLGKIKTVIQFVSLICIFWASSLTEWLGLAGIVLLYLATLMTIVSAVIYIRTALKERSLNSSKDHSLNPSD